MAFFETGGVASLDKRFVIDHRYFSMSRSFSFDTSESLCKFLLSENIMDKPCLFIKESTKPEPPYQTTLRQLSILFKNTVDMNAIANGCEVKLDSVIEKKEHLRKIFTMVLELCQKDPLFVLWSSMGDFDHFQQRVLDDVFLEQCCLHQSQFVTVERLSLFGDDKHQKTFMSIDSNALRKHFPTLREDRTSFEKEESVFWEKVENHVSHFTEQLMYVCYVYDMCFIKKKVWECCFSFSDEDCGEVACGNKEGHQKLCVSGGRDIRKGSSPTSDSDDDRASRELGKRYQSVQAGELHDQASPLKKRKQEGAVAWLIKKCEMLSDLQASSLRPFDTTKTYRNSPWWNKMILLMIYTQKKNHTLMKDGSILHFPLDRQTHGPEETWTLNESDYLDYSEYRRVGSGRRNFCNPHGECVLPLWYPFILKNIKQFSLGCKKPYKDQTIDVLACMSLSDGFEKVLDALHRLESSRVDNQINYASLKRHIAIYFKTVHTVRYPHSSDLWNKSVMCAITKYAVFFHEPITSSSQ